MVNRQMLIRIRCFRLFGLFLLLMPFTIMSKELVIGTTFSTDATVHLIKVWEQQSNHFPIRTLNRTSMSLNQLLSTSKAGNVDLILSSSPMLFDSLQSKGELADLPATIKQHSQFVPEVLQNTTAAFSISGYGILSNSAQFESLNISIPGDWYDLVNPALQDLVIISSPSRSETNHIMLEALLQQQGWDKGWELISQISANVGTISSRSFGVADKIQANLGAAGITIDNYANLLTQNESLGGNRLVFHYFPNFPVSPTFISVTAKSTHKAEALTFIQFLLSEEGQRALSDSETGKYPIQPLSTDNPLAEKQQFLFSQPQINYDLLLKRQELVKLLFEHAITYRLNQLKTNWRLIYAKEQAVGRQLPEVRAIIASFPITEQQSVDDDYLNNFNLSSELLKWQEYFSQQQAELVKTLEDLQ
ncbi:ABC transporter substrate-binding protein [Zophobihabitans entericus]|uniref:ABC transporter substrate-binding protein n=2 Tax=Zophobihabitans entericus TaxID=1635327 RepID=A0A6G9IFK8_9GAMM|nr:ABC transporter substrate-binding protein [Zophobihabitans entericus]